MTRLMFLVAFVVFTVYVGILAFEVPSPDLIAVIVLTVVLVAYDFISSSRGKPD